ncbi:MAG TPA: V-type ATP synthase subunit A [Actinomycetota bacterium]
MSVASETPERSVGRIVRVAGPVVTASGLERVRLYELVLVGEAGLMGEAIRLEGKTAVIQVYEDTFGLRAGDPVAATDAPLALELGPGLLGSIFDGVQRPLVALAAEGGRAGAFLPKGATLPALDRARTWGFAPVVEAGRRVEAGSVLGTVAETPAIEHRVLVPPGVAGTVTDVRDGPAGVEDPVVWIDGRPLPMLQRWPVRRARPARRRLDPTRPLVTGQRVIDTLFPVAIGGTAAIPGGFGTGKTVQEQALARWMEADVVVYVGCGERGNELTDVLEQFPRLVDPRSGAPLMERTILVANTSNMPMAAREASVYTGITLAEYYRDQGYDVVVLADSTSRWAEALREVSGRLEEMPGEEGYPAYLPARLAEFYERAGAVECLGDEERRGSVTVVGAVSPPGGDLSEPVTQHSLRVNGTLWALDVDLARRRHFPAIDWIRSYSLYELSGWFHREVDPGWEDARRWALALLQREEQLLAIVRILGSDALAAPERVVLRTGQRLREDFLRQSAFDPEDAFCPLDKQLRMLQVIRRVHDLAMDAVARGADPERVLELPAVVDVGRMRAWPPEEARSRGDELLERLDREVAEL